MPTRKQSKQARHREKLLNEGGLYLTVELSPDAVQDMHTVMERDQLPTKRAAIEDSLKVNARRPKKPSP